MKTTIIAIPGLMLLTHAFAVQAQVVRLPDPWKPPQLVAHSSVTDRMRGPRPDLRWPGTVVGAAGLGLATGLTAAAVCGNSENGPRDCTGPTVGYTLLGVSVGAVAGHFLGRLIHR